MVQTPHSVVHALDPSVRSPAGRRLAPKIHLFDKIIEILLADAHISHADIASRLGRTAVWVGYIMRSDAFRDLYEHRRAAQVGRGRRAGRAGRRGRSAPRRASHV